MDVTILTPMWKDARHVWFIACMCLLHPTLASFSSWLRIIGVAAPYHRVGQYVTFKFQYTQRCCTRVQQLIYGYICVLIHGLHCASKQLTPCDTIMFVSETAYDYVKSAFSHLTTKHTCHSSISVDCDGGRRRHVFSSYAIDRPVSPRWCLVLRRVL